MDHGAPLQVKTLGGAGHSSARGAKRFGADLKGEVTAAVGPDAAGEVPSVALEALGPADRSRAQRKRKKKCGGEDADVSI